GKESPSATEIELIKSRAVIGKVVDNLTLDLTVEPNRFPVIGDFIARRFKPDAVNTVAAPWLGMSSFAWGGEKLKVFQLELPQALLSKELTLVSGENGRFTLLDDDDNILAQSQVGQAYDQDGIKLQVEVLQANPGTRFSIV